MAGDPSPVLDRALALLRQGRCAEGETLLVQAVGLESEASQKPFFKRLVRKPRDGATTPVSKQHAAALFDLARYMLACDDPERAVRPLTVASALEPGDDASRRDRITYGMNLGQALQLAGRLDEAERALRANVAERRSFYGGGSEGLAWGLEPLAGVLLVRGAFDEARRSADQALAILWKARSPHVAHVLPLLGAIQVASGATPPFVPRLDELPAELKLEALDDALFRARIARDVPSLQVALEVITHCASRSGNDTPIANGWAKLFYAARSIGAHDIAITAARAYLDTRKQAGDEPAALKALASLALELADAGRMEEATADFVTAEAQARSLGNQLILAHVLRNWGLVLSDRNEQGWREKLEEALATAEGAGEPANGEEVAQACGALGIRLQHEGDIVGARQLLERGVALGEQVLAPTDSNLFAMRTHLESVRAGKTCGCSPDGTIEQKHAYETAVTALAQKSLPPGLLERAEMEEDGKWSVKLTRQLESEQELNLVMRSLEQALAEMRASTRN